jgi:hypothetical protein
MTSHQERLGQLEFSLINAYGELHGEVKSARRAVELSIQQVRRAESKVDEVMQLLLREIQQLQLEVGDQVLADPVAKER